MSSQLSEKQSYPVPASETAIYIVGPHILQNELLALCFGREISEKCFRGDDLSYIPHIDHERGSNHPGLVFWDCQGKGRKELFREFIPCFNHKLFGHLVVLFNVIAGLGIEEECVAMGVRGFFYEHDPLEKLLKGIRAVLDGEVWLSRKMITRCLYKSSSQRQSSGKEKMVLTPREIEILALVAVGDANEEIADKLCISPYTVKTHLYKTFKKINVTNRLQAAFWATQYL